MTGIPTGTCAYLKDGQFAGVRAYMKGGQFAGVRAYVKGGRPADRRRAARTHGQGGPPPRDVPD